MNILITNDDGLEAPGLRAAFDAVRELGNVHVVAPKSERSACSHMITLWHPIAVEELRHSHFGTAFAVDGTPADCVRLAVAELINEPITNLTDLGSRRSTFHVGVRYGTDVELTARVLEKAAASCDTTHKDPAPEALISQMGDHSIEFLLRFWHHPGILEAERAKDAVGHAITREFASHGIVIAFQQLTMWWGADAEGKTSGQ